MRMGINSLGHVTAPKGGGNIPQAKMNALDAAYNLREYLLVHYTMLREYSGVDVDGKSNLNLHGLVHYHVYGDYRLLMSEVLGPHIDAFPPPLSADEMERANGEELDNYIREIEEHYDTTQSVMSPLIAGTPDNIFRTIPLLRFKTTNYGENLAEDNGQRLYNLLALEGTNVSPDNGIDKLNGFFGFQQQANLGEFVKQGRSITEISRRMSQWSNNQLHAGTQATRFFLPSLGTLLVAGDLTKLAKYVGGRVSSTIDFVVDDLAQNRYNYLYQYQMRTPEQLENEYGVFRNNIRQHLEERDIEDAPRFFYEWAKHICSHPDYIMYLEQNLNNIGADEQAIITACGGPIFNNRNPNTDPTIRVIRPSQIFAAAKSATQRQSLFSAGENFIKDLLNVGRQELGVGTAIKLKEASQNALTAVVEGLPEDDGDNDALKLEFDADDVFYISAVAGNRYQIERTYRGEYNDTQQFPIHPMTGNPYDRADSNQWYVRGDFNVYDEDDETELDEEGLREKDVGGKIDALHKVFMRIVMDVYMTFETYASLLSNFVGYKKFSKFQGKKKDPNMASPVGGDGGGSNKPIGEFLVEERLEITLGQLATQYAGLKGNIQTMKDFYSQDLLGAEVQWLSNSISQFSPTLTSATTPSKPNLLVREMYIPPAGLGPDQEYQLERVKPEVIFLRLDSALLRDIFIEYTRQHNRFISQVARQSAKKGKKNRRGQNNKNKNKKNEKILPVMWTLVKQQALSVAQTENLKPHVMWNVLLDAVDKFRSERTMQYPLIPEHWATTFTVANLRKDPELYGETIDEVQQKALLIEYLDFLESTYYNSFNFLGSLSAALDKIRILMISDLDTLKRLFVERLHQDASAKVLGRRFFPAYQKLLFIMRSFADIPPSVRGEYSAMVFDEEARTRMQEQMRSTSGSRAAEPIVAKIQDGSPAQARPEQVERRPGL